MNRVMASGLLLLLATVATSTRADQNDPRLDGLFARLHDSADEREAQELERQIWSIWLTTADDDVAVVLDKGIRAMSTGRVDEAIAHFGQIVERAPDFAEGWNKRATALYLRQDYAGSMQDIQRTLALEPRHFGAISGMGMILLATGDPTSAMTAFEAVLRIHPTAQGARHYLEMLRKALVRGGA